jgi:hypothetical protein
VFRQNTTHANIVVTCANRRICRGRLILGTVTVVVRDMGKSYTFVVAAY